MLCRLAAKALPRGDFWVTPKNLVKTTSKWRGSKAISFIQGTIHHIQSKSK